MKRFLCCHWFLCTRSVRAGVCLAPYALIALLLGGFVTVLLAGQVRAEGEFSPLSVKTGVLLVASPSLDDPNFRRAVVLIVEHGPRGTLGIVLNRPTKTLLFEGFPDLDFLKNTTHRVFVGGPVAPNRLFFLFRLKESDKDAHPVYDGVYVGGSVALLKRVVTQALPTETFRAFAGCAGWAPRQLEFEMQQGAWGVLPPGTFDVFEKDSATLWRNSVARLQAPRVISN